MPMFTLLVSLPLLALGAWLLVRGFRGRPIPGVRECAQCGHEVDPAAIPAACAECGADLSKPRGVRNRRKRSKALAIVGAWLIAFGLSVGGLGLWSLFSQATPWPSIPTGVLSFVLRNGSDNLADNAAAEFATRLSAGGLSDAETRALAAEIASRIEDSNRAWNRAWDPLAAMLRTRGHLADATWGAFFERSLRFELLAPAKVRPESVIWFGFETTARPIQFGQLQQYAGSMRLSLVGLWIGGVAIGEDRRSGMTARSVIDGGKESMSTQALLPQFPHGQTTIDAELRLDIIDGQLDSEKVLLSKTLRISKPIAVVGKDEPLIEVVRDKSVGDAFRSAITLREAKAHRQRGGGCMVDLSFDLGEAPADAAFRILLRTRDGNPSPREFALSTLEISRARPTPVKVPSGSVDGLEPGRYDVVLRPSLELAEVALDFTHAWLGEDIVIEDVELTPDEVSEPASPSSESAR